MGAVELTKDEFEELVSCILQGALSELCRLRALSEPEAEELRKEASHGRYKSVRILSGIDGNSAAGGLA